MKKQIPAAEASVWSQPDRESPSSQPHARLPSGLRLESARHELPPEPQALVAAASVGSAPTRYAWYVILLLSVVNIFNYMDRMAFSVLVPSIKADIGLSDSALGLLTGFAFAMFYAICGIPIARWADSGVRRNIIALALSTWSVMTALSGAAQNFWQLFLARVGVGVGEAGGLAPAQSIICDYVPVPRRSGVLAIHAVGLTVGMFVGMALAGWLGERIGWRWTFVVLGIPGIALALVVRLTLREPTRGIFDAVRDETRPSLRDTFKILFNLKVYRLMILYGVSVGFVSFGLMQWRPSLYMRVYALDASTVGIYLGIAMGVGSGIGLLAGGIIANKMALRGARSPLIMGAIAAYLALPAGLISLVWPSAFGAIFAAFVTELLLNVAGAPIISTMYSIVSSRMRATAGTTAVFFQALLGFGLGPFSVGLLSDVLAPAMGAESLRYALLVPVLLIPTVGAVVHAIARAIPDSAP